MGVVFFHAAKNEVRETCHSLELPDCVGRGDAREFLPVGKRNVARLELRRNGNVGEVFAELDEAVVLGVFNRKRDVD